MIDWPFAPLRPFSYRVIMADPPWSFAARAETGYGKSPQGHYDCMSLDTIKALPVRRLAQDDCWLWLWATYPMLPQALEVMSAWRFTYVTGGPWVKRGTSGKLAFGTGFVFRCAAEQVLIGKIGNPPVASRSIRNVIEAPRREHSRKPDEAYVAAETLFGPGRRADLFARESRFGWDAWGQEAGKFDGLAEPQMRGSDGSGIIGSAVSV